ncbi:MAG: helix-turn-helix transcriptional regulator [Verrucomicrobia bacterium]|nr:helix-turn-helix transcriptional regulator [Verrucomicrobiota bacterium]
MNEPLHEIRHWPERAAQAGWCVATLAANCGVSVATLERYFHEHLGQCPHEWLNHDRMRRAQELLGAGSNVQETADQLGYNNQQNFSLAFKRYFGYPPSHLRKTEDGRRKTEDGRRKTEDGRRKTEDARWNRRRDEGGTLILEDKSYRFPFAFWRRSGLIGARSRRLNGSLPPSAQANDEKERKRYDQIKFSENQVGVLHRSSGVYSLSARAGKRL